MMSSLTNQSKYALLSLILTLFLLLNTNLIAQADSYYSGLDVNSSTFITDLQAKIRSNYTKISYDNFDETNVANYASYDNGAEPNRFFVSTLLMNINISAHSHGEQ